MRSARLAYEEAGIGPDELDVVELHDAASGTIPVNPGGGLLARGHPNGATGYAQLVELCD